MYNSTVHRKEVDIMVKWIIAYKDSNDKWRAWAKVGSFARIAEKLETLKKHYPNVKVIQIQRTME